MYCSLNFISAALSISVLLLYIALTNAKVRVNSVKKVRAYKLSYAHKDAMVRSSLVSDSRSSATAAAGLYIACQLSFVEDITP